MRFEYLDTHQSPADAGRILAACGLVYRRMDTRPEAYQRPLDELKAANGYVQQDIVDLRPDTPDLEEICAKFSGEHAHAHDEVRFVLEGSGIFDVRDGNDRWMRVTVEPGDLIIVPAGAYHRFYLTDAKTIRCVRLFKDPAGWAARYRQAS